MSALEIQYEDQKFIIGYPDAEVCAVFTSLNHPTVMSTVCEVDKLSGLRKEWKFKKPIKENSIVKIGLVSSVQEESSCSYQSSLNAVCGPKSKMERFKEIERILMDRGLL